MRSAERFRKAAALILTANALFVSAGALPVKAQECVDSKCHFQMGTSEFVHGPLKVGQCVICHTDGNLGHPTGLVNGDFKFQAQGKDLCYLCHEPKDDQRVVHGPLAEGDCVSCHDPHQSDTELRLTEASTTDLCFSCHEDNTAGKSVVHGPVAAGDCGTCHDPHSTYHKGLVEVGGAELCFLCHPDQRDQFEREYRHELSAGGCDDCHDPHATDFPHLLLSDEKTLCLDCHLKMDKHLKESSMKHSALSTETCTDCHLAHGSNYPHQLKTPAREICYVCHEGLEARIKDSRYLHGPVSRDDCHACHDSHGSDFTSILKKPYPADLYKPYSTEAYALCFDCHNSEIALDRVTATGTGFRNGNRNLHFLHVNREKGRSCKACHEIHAGDQPKHIRREVPFGGRGWMLPVIFTQSPSGGRCVVGCHKPKSYDRVDPVKYR